MVKGKETNTHTHTQTEMQVHFNFTNWDDKSMSYHGGSNFRTGLLHGFDE